MAETSEGGPGGFEIRSEAHGPHWIAWVAQGSEGRPLNSVVLVGQTQEEAEARARRWAEQLLRQPQSREA